jgi:YrbI family 3-deoxy-D-manno-octulosonate 8-phosphate phosphatase
MRAVAVIPARGGSVGLPGKNTKLLNGIPLLGRAVAAAGGAKLVSAVYVSSDSTEILKVGEKFGAIGIQRPPEISGATASSESALLHALGIIAETEFIEPDIIVFLQCTSPFTTAAHIDRLVASMIEQGADSAFAAIEDHSFIWQIATDGTATGITHDHTQPRQRRQDMAPRYRESGAIYAMRVPAFLSLGNRFCGKTILVPVEMPPIEIDTMEDWEIAEAYAQILERPTDYALGSVRIRALVTDFDGVHTDDRVIVQQDGSEAVRCSRRDGMGIEILRERGLHLLILSREQNPVVGARAAKLKIEVQHHIREKLPALDDWRRDKGLEWHEIAYVGNDVNDVDCMKACGFSFAPADAHDSARSIATVVLGRDGGNGALRELCDYLVCNKMVA